MNAAMVKQPSTSGVDEAETESTSTVTSMISNVTFRAVHGGIFNCKACVVDWLGHSKERRDCFESIFQKEDEEKAMKEAADAAATSAVLLVEAATSLTDSSTTTTASSSMEQFVDYPVGMEISEVNLKRSEFKEVPESRKVRRISGSTVCSMDIVGTAQADYGNTQLSETEFERKADEESDARHMHTNRRRVSRFTFRRWTSLE